jgi:hypothetical protein
MRSSTSKRQGRKYAAIPNELMRNNSLSLEARGLIALMMGYSDDWKFHRNHLLAVSGIGREKFQRIMVELQNAGYVELISTKSADGKFNGQTYIIHDEPASAESLKTRLSVDDAESLKTRSSEKPVVGKPVPIRRPTTQENLFKKENQTREFFEFSEGIEKVAPKPTVDDQFEEWWKLYPERKGNPKKPALNKFRSAIRKTTFERLKSAVSAYARSRIGEDPTYTAMATTWLSQERWAEHVEAKQIDHKVNPFEGLPPHMAQAVNYVLDPAVQRKIALDYWERQEAI